MKEFDWKDFNIQISANTFSGHKISVNSLLNRRILVHDYKIERSKYKGDCLHLSFDLDGERRIAFIGGKKLIEGIEQVPKECFPFKTSIVFKGGCLQFS